MIEIQNVTDSTFQTVVLGSDRPTIVDFWAAWCGPCKMVAPEMQKLADKYDGIVDVVKVNVDENPDLTQAFGIQSIPLIAFFQKGIAPQGIQGFQPAEQIESKFGLKALAR